MKFKFVISKWANFYFFVSNLSEWHFSCRPAYNKFWGKELGKLSKKEQSALKLFVKLHKKYPLGGDFFGQVFFVKKHPFAVLKKELPLKHFRSLKSVFELFAPRFEKLYKKELPFLKGWATNLKKSANRISIIKKINTTLANLYHAEPLIKKHIKVYLLFSSPNRNGGGANMDNKSVTLELSRYPLRATNQVIGVVWHELIHLHFENNNFIPSINKIYRGDKKMVDLIKEATASSLLPNGILGINLLHIKSKLLNARIPIRHTKPLLKISKKYFENNKFFDEQFIRKVNAIIQVDK